MRISITVSALCITLAVAACSMRPVTAPSAMFPVECEIIASPEYGIDTITVVLPGRVHPEHAPWPRNASERSLFNHLYENLFTTNCLGEVHAELAESWTVERNGTQWTFVLREGALFWNGDPVTAADVVRSWHYATVELAALATGIDSVIVVGERSLQVHFSRGGGRLPSILSGPAFVVAKHTRNGEWPIGSGMYRVAGRTSPGRLSLAPAQGENRPVLDFVIVPNRDARDFVESGVEVVFTADPRVIDYASGRQTLATVPLPWSQTYVLLSPARANVLGRGEDIGQVSSELVSRLAHEAVRADARGWRPKSWWETLEHCETLVTSVRDGLDLDRSILYEAGDPVAQDLAERLVALSAGDPDTNRETHEIASAVPGIADGSTTMIAAGLSRKQFGRRLRAGDAVGYVVAVPRTPADRCYEAHKLVNRAPWLMPGPLDLADLLIPLVDTRYHVIADPSRVGLIVDWEGNILPVSGKLEQR